jgi:hypothetical protein
VVDTEPQREQPQNPTKMGLSRKICVDEEPWVIVAVASIFVAVTSVVPILIQSLVENGLRRQLRQHQLDVAVLARLVIPTDGLSIASMSPAVQKIVSSPASTDHKVGKMDWQTSTVRVVCGLLASFTVSITCYLIMYNALGVVALTCTRDAVRPMKRTLVT